MYRYNSSENIRFFSTSFDYHFPLFSRSRRKEAKLNDLSKTKTRLIQSFVLDSTFPHIFIIEFVRLNYNYHNVAPIAYHKTLISSRNVHFSWVEPSCKVAKQNSYSSWYKRYLIVHSTVTTQQQSLNAFMYRQKNGYKMSGLSSQCLPKPSRYNDTRVHFVNITSSKIILPKNAS